MGSERARFVVAAFALLAGCDRVNAAKDRAFGKLSITDPCPEATPGRVAGTDSPDAAFACFQRAVAAKDAQMLGRVTCRSRQPASCKQTDATDKELQAAMTDLAKVEWSSGLGSFQDGKANGFVVDTHPKEKRVSVVYVCKIAEGEKWAVCDVGELPRDAAEKKTSK